MKIHVSVSTLGSAVCTQTVPTVRALLSTPWVSTVEESDLRPVLASQARGGTLLTLRRFLKGGICSTVVNSMEHMVIRVINYSQKIYK